MHVVTLKNKEQEIFRKMSIEKIHNLYYSQNITRLLVYKKTHNTQVFQVINFGF
jgi:citrate lyase synthetase